MILNVSKYLNKNGYNTVDSGFYTMIGVWKSWYKSNVRKFHKYRVYNGKKYVNCDRLGLGMAKKSAEDIADLLLNERVKITISDQTSDSYVKSVLNSRENKFFVNGNKAQETKAYSGTVAYVPYMDNITLDAEGRIISAGDIKINYISAEDIFPISWTNGYISECAFVIYKTVDNKRYAQIQIHKIVNNEYVIENHVVECTNDIAGQEVPVEKWKSIKGFETLAEKIRTGSSERQFVIDTLNIVNNYDPKIPMGIPIFANAIDILKGIDTVYDSYVNEFVLGKKRIFTAPEYLQEDITGSPVFDPNDVVFYTLPEDSLDKTGGKPLVEVDMTLRSQEHETAINDNLNMFSVKCGFGMNHYKFETGSIQTATQVISENSDMYRSVKKHELILDDVIQELVRIIIRMGIGMGNALNEGVTIKIDFDDSIIEDKQTERKQDMQDVSMGAMSLEEYRAKWYGESEEVAKKKLPERDTVIE